MPLLDLVKLKSTHVTEQDSYTSYHSTHILSVLLLCLSEDFAQFTQSTKVLIAHIPIGLLTQNQQGVEPAPSGKDAVLCTSVTCTQTWEPTMGQVHNYFFKLFNSIQSIVLTAALKEMVVFRGKITSFFTLLSICKEKQNQIKTKSTAIQPKLNFCLFANSSLF